jgi:hypothetical protein
MLFTPLTTWVTARSAVVCLAPRSGFAQCFGVHIRTFTRCYMLAHSSSALLPPGVYYVSGFATLCSVLHHARVCRWSACVTLPNTGPRQ